MGRGCRHLFRSTPLLTSCLSAPYFSSPAAYHLFTGGMLPTKGYGDSSLSYVIFVRLRFCPLFVSHIPMDICRLNKHMLRHF